MDKITFITTMTFWSYSIDIFYQARENGSFGYAYSIKEGEVFIDQSDNEFRTALKAGHGALTKLQGIHNEKD